MDHLVLFQAGFASLGSRECLRGMLFHSTCHTHQVASVRAADRSGMTFVLMAFLGYECMQPASDSLQPPRHEDASESLKRPLHLPQQLDSLPCFGLCWEIHACGCSTQALKPPWPALLLETTLPKLT